MRNVTVRFRCSHKEFEELKGKAEAASRTVSDYIRLQVLGSGEAGEASVPYVATMVPKIVATREFQGVAPGSFQEARDSVLEIEFRHPAAWVLTTTEGKTHEFS